MRKAGYSLLEVMVAIFILGALIMASFSVLESGERESTKLEHFMVAARLAQKISEELHSKAVSGIINQSNIHFDPPFDQYLYSVETANYLDLHPSDPLGVANLLQISIQATGPIDAGGNQTEETATISLSTLLGRQPFP